MSDAPRYSTGSADPALCGVIADAIRDYCHKVSPAAVQDSHGKERIYYSGIDLQALAEAIFIAIPGLAQGQSDCGITDAMVQEACEVYGEVYRSDDKDMGDAMRAALRAALGMLDLAYAAWQPIETAPNSDDFRLYGLYVTNNKTGSRWFEAHYLSWNDDGQLVLSSGDNFDDWAYSDFEFWAPSPSLPSTHLGCGDPNCKDPKCEYGKGPNTDPLLDSRNPNHGRIGGLRETSEVTSTLDKTP